jgi:hypothetical protein
MNYDPIFAWNMTPTEMEAYKLAKIWENEAHKMCPNEKTPRLLKRGDPRKSHLFRCCWKMWRETKGLLQPDEYPLYIHAQLFCMKHFKGYVDPTCLAGDKAWIRWKVWKRKYDRKIAEKQNTTLPIDIHNFPLIAKELLLTKKFLYERCDGDPCKEKIESFLSDGFLQMWIISGKISRYYLALSPYIKPHLERLERECSFDVLLVKERLTEDIERYFKEEFANEYHLL